MSDFDMLSTLVLNDLKEMGIKHKWKKPKVIKNSQGQRLFSQGLQHLKLADAFLANGSVVEVPQFVAEACNYILEHCETEGIFRKAGSAATQREIRKCLEAGLPLGKSHRVIDIANILTYFFRELPEPLIPSYLHDTLVRCLLSPEPYRIRSIQLTCLLTPPLTIHTLAYFMQFLNTISKHDSLNKMNVQNLAIVIAPSVIPYRDINSIRFKNHIKIVELLIQNANTIGTIPACISKKLNNSSQALTNSVLTGKASSDGLSTMKSKNRRSQFFSALRTKVESSINSTEHLGCPVKSSKSSNELYNAESKKEQNARSRINVRTDKFSDPFNAFRAKKHENKHSNSNLIKNQAACNTSPKRPTKNIRERRWSLVNTEWSKYKKRENILHNIDTEVFNTKPKDDSICQRELISNTITTNSNNNIHSENACNLKSDHKAISERVASMETQIAPKRLIKYNANKSKFESCEQNNMKPLSDLEEITFRTDRINKSFKKRRYTNENFIHTPSKIKTLSKTQESTPKTFKTWQNCASSDLSLNRSVHTTEIANTLQMADVSTTKNNLTQNEDLISSEKWLPADEYFSKFSKHTESKEFKYYSSSLSKNMMLIKSNTKDYDTNHPETSMQRNYSRRLDSQRKMFVEDRDRSSITRLRSENAGMVLAKAKLFDDFNDCVADAESKNVPKKKNIENTKKCI